MFARIYTMCVCVSVLDKGHSILLYDGNKRANNRILQQSAPILSSCCCCCCCSSLCGCVCTNAKHFSCVCVLLSLAVYVCLNRLMIARISSRSSSIDNYKNTYHTFTNTHPHTRTQSNIFHLPSSRPLALLDLHMRTTCILRPIYIHTYTLITLNHSICISKKSFFNCKMCAWKQWKWSFN